jgi:hypothetical protein
MHMFPRLATGAEILRGRKHRRVLALVPKVLYDSRLRIEIATQAKMCRCESHLLDCDPKDSTPGYCGLVSDESRTCSRKPSQSNTRMPESILLGLTVSSIIDRL